VTFRNLHNWMGAGYAPAALEGFYRALKPGGILGIEDHRGREDAPQDPKADNGYVRQDYTIELAKKAGSEFVVNDSGDIPRLGSHILEGGCPVLLPLVPEHSGIVGCQRKHCHNSKPQDTGKNSFEHAALAVMVRTSLRSQFRRIDPLSARIVLVDMGNRVLGTFAENISAAAKQRLERLGVEVLLGKAVEKIDEDGITAGGERIASKTVIWTAGVAPSPAGKWLAVETDRAGRVKVQPDCSVPGHSEIFVVGDTALLQQDGKPLPGVAQVAMQQGRYVGQLIDRRLSGKSAPRPFRYFDKGNMAVVGKGFAVLQSGKIHLSGFFAWLAWAGIHIQFLATTNLRVSVFVQWMWTFLTGQRGSRLIVNHRALGDNPRPEKAFAGDSNGITENLIHR